ncbi:MAG: hypothetical protein ACRDPB_08520 [Nocardioidaceae bacterium]
MLLQAGADPNDDCGGDHPETPLHWAASTDDVDVAAVLIDGALIWRRQKGPSALRSTTRSDTAAGTSRGSSSPGARRSTSFGRHRRLAWSR